MRTPIINKRNFIPRLIVSPLIFSLLTVSYTIGLFKHFIGYIRFGGEWVTYTEASPDITLRKIYDTVKEKE